MVAWGLGGLGSEAWGLGLRPGGLGAWGLGGLGAWGLGGLGAWGLGGLGAWGLGGLGAKAWVFGAKVWEGLRHG